MLYILARRQNGNLADVDGFSHLYPGWFLTSSNNARVALRSRLRSGKSAFKTCASRAWPPFQPAGARTHDAIYFKCKRSALSHFLLCRLRRIRVVDPSLEDPREVVVNDRRLAFAVQQRGHAVVWIFCRQPPHEGFGSAEKLLICGRIRPALFDQVIYFARLGHYHFAPTKQDKQDRQESVRRKSEMKGWIRQPDPAPSSPRTCH
jgi:hypothetical protein